MKEKFSWESEDVIWGVWPDQLLGNLVLEVRNPAQKTVNFVVIHAEHGSLIFQGFDQSLDWWSVTRYVDNGILLVESYQNNDLPETRGLKAFSYIKNDLMWENPFLGFVQASQHYLECKTPQDETIWVTLQDGNPAKSPGLSQFTSPFGHVQWLSPAFRIYDQLLAYLNTHSGFTEVKNVYYGEPLGCMLLSFEAEDEMHKMKCLWLMNEAGERLWEKKWNILNNSQPLIQFFWTETTLFVLENQHLITAYELD